MITLTCFDMAGTTVRDDGVVASCFTAAFEATGLELGTDAYTVARRYAIETMGYSKIEVFTHIFDGDQKLAQTANEAFESTYDNAVETDQIKPIEGAEQLFAELREHQITVALTTGFSPATRDRLIDSLGWHELIDFALSPADVGGRGRPHPDMLLAAMLRAQVEDVRDVAVFGDTVSDILAGARSGASIVAAVRTGGCSDADFAASPRTHIIDSVAGAAPLLFDAS